MTTKINCVILSFFSPSLIINIFQVLKTVPIPHSLTTQSRWWGLECTVGLAVGRRCRLSWLSLHLRRRCSDRRLGGGADCGWQGHCWPEGPVSVCVAVGKGHRRCTVSIISAAPRGCRRSEQQANTRGLAAKLPNAPLITSRGCFCAVQWFKFKSDFSLLYD